MVRSSQGGKVAVRGAQSGEVAVVEEDFWIDHYREDPLGASITC
jgi:hypothetical protein